MLRGECLSSCVALEWHEVYEWVGDGSSVLVFGRCDADGCSWGLSVV